MAELSIPEFLDYLRAFNNKQYDKQHAFYSDDVELVLPDLAIGTLKGSSGIKSHYNMVHADADETVVPIVVLTGPGYAFLQMEAYFKYIRKAKAVHDFEAEQRDVFKICTCALYSVNDERKFSRIKCYVDTAEKLGQVDVQQKIRESEQRANFNIGNYRTKL